MDARNKDVRNLGVLVAATLVVAACGGGSGSMTPPPPPANVAPTVSMIANQAADQDTAVTIDFTVDDRESGAGAVTVSVTADGTALFPADGVVLSGSGAMRRLTLTPLEATTGNANIAVRAVDPEGLATTRSFAVAVNAKNASIRDKVYETFARGESEAAVAMNGWTPDQDANDVMTFAPLIPAGEE